MFKQGDQQHQGHPQRIKSHQPVKSDNFGRKVLYQDTG